MKKRMISYFVCTALLAASPGQAVLAGMPENDGLQTENIKETELEEETTADKEQPQETEEEKPETQLKETDKAEEPEDLEQPEDESGEEKEPEEKEPAEVLKESEEEKPEEQPEGSEEEKPEAEPEEMKKSEEPGQPEGSEEEKPEEQPEESEEEKPEAEPEEMEKSEEPGQPEEEPEDKEPTEVPKESEEEKPEEQSKESEEEKPEEQPQETEEEKPEAEPEETEKAEDPEQPEDEPAEEEIPEETKEAESEDESEESHIATYHQTTYSRASVESQDAPILMYPETENLLPDQSEDDMEFWEPKEEPENEEEKAIPPLLIQNLRSFSANRSAVVPSVSVAKQENGRNLVNIELQTPEGTSVPLSCIQEDDGDYIRYQVPKITEDGQYALKVERIDDDGSSVSEKMVFSVNQQGTKFIYNEEKSEISAKERYAPEVYLENVDEIAVVSCTVNGQEAAYEMEGAILRIHEEELAEGRNEIALSVRDAAGNVSRMEPWEIFRSVSAEEKITQNADSAGVFSRTGRLYPEALRRILLTTR